MDVVICKDAQEVGEVAADRWVECIDGIQTPVLGVATGSSPLALYEALAARVQAGTLDLTHALAFALDEYVGISPRHPESYIQVVRRHVIEPLGLNPSRVRVPEGHAADPHKAAADYDAAIKAAGGVDVQILGIGSNGHIAFNEPYSSFASRTRVEALTPQTRQDNARFFDSVDEVPTHCITQGLGTIMESRAAVLVASGKNKADAVRAMVEGPVTASCPATILQFHPSVVVVIDEAAASELSDPDYFRQMAAAKGLRG